MIAVAMSPTKQSGILQDLVPGASPWVITNTTNQNMMIFVGGGTVSIIAAATDGVNFLVTGLVGGQFVVPPGGKLRITYILTPVIAQSLSF